MPYGKNPNAGSALPANAAFQEVPAGAIDGLNAAFTLVNAPAPGASLSLYKNGVFQTAGIDYNLAGNTITYVAGAIPQVGDAHVCDYFF